MGRLAVEIAGLVACLLLAGCGAGGPSTAPPTEQSPTVVDSTLAPTVPAPSTVRLTVTTNFSQSDRHFVVVRLEDPDGWGGAPLVLVNQGYEFLVDLPIGARYTIGLSAVEGASFGLPDPQEIDLRNPSAGQLERTLEYKRLGGSTKK